MARFVFESKTKRRRKPKRFESTKDTKHGRGGRGKNARGTKQKNKNDKLRTKHINQRRKDGGGADRRGGEQHRKWPNRRGREREELAHGESHRVRRRELVGKGSPCHQNSLVGLRNEERTGGQYENNAGAK